MTGARTWLGVSVCWLMSIAVGAPTALAESLEYSYPQGRYTAYATTTASYPDTCTYPDSGTLSAIVPVATDHGSHASGIVIDDNRVLTAAHAVQGAGHFFVRVGDLFRSADLVMVDHRNDLAVLAVDTGMIVPLRIAGLGPVPSDLVWAAGYPRAQAMSTSVGVLQELREGALHSSAAIDSGQSGGGLLSCSAGRWSLVGMLRGFGAYLQGDQYVKLQNHSVSVAGRTITEFLSNYH